MSLPLPVLIQVTSSGFVLHETQGCKKVSKVGPAKDQCAKGFARYFDNHVAQDTYDNHAAMICYGIKKKPQQMKDKVSAEPSE